MSTNMLQQAKDAAFALLRFEKVTHAVKRKEEAEQFVTMVIGLLKSFGLSKKHVKTLMEGLTLTSPVALTKGLEPIQVPFTPGTFTSTEKRSGYAALTAVPDPRRDVAQPPLKTAYANLNEDGNISVHGGVQNPPRHFDTRNEVPNQPLSKESNIMADNQGQLVLAQNQHALIQDITKGIVSVYVGPVNTPIGNNERPVIYDRKRDAFVQVSLDQAIRQNPFVPEGHYMVLENPADELRAPKSGSSNQPIELRIGRKVNVPGPATFPLWPGQVAEVVAGHHLRSNQYLLVRVYNPEEAARSATGVLRTTAAPLADPESSIRFAPGQQIVIKGTESSFFIPPTGFEVLPDVGAGGAYVREALTLERLEYAILLDENGSKRYERGPQVVFPEATETFITRADTQDDGKGSRNRKFKAIELNDYMGLYIKVTADYEESVDDEEAVMFGASLSQDGDYNDVHGSRYSVRGGKAYRQYKTGEELFITGKEQRIYYQRAEHALIGYDDPAGGGFKRERWYGITIPKGEGRYVLDKSAGAIKMVVGPKIFLPDPRNETIARRLLDPKTVSLWYPGNQEALAFNQTLASQANEDTGYLTYNVVSSDAAARSINRMTAGNIKGDRFSRSGNFTPPPTLTLGAATKYEGVPSIGVWTGYAVQVVDKAGKRRIVVGPESVLLEYDETLEVLELSTGRPKNTDALMRTTYLRVEHNLVSDEISAETKDLVPVKLKLSYRVNFLPEHKDRWFSVENYVKYLCDHMRSFIKADIRKRALTELIADSAAIVRDVVLGPKPVVHEGEPSEPSKLKRHHFFPENGMDVYDVEVLSVDIAEPGIANTLRTGNMAVVQNLIKLATDEQALEVQRRSTEIELERNTLTQKATLSKLDDELQLAARRAEAAMQRLEAEIAEEVRRASALITGEQAENDVHEHQLMRRKADDEQDLLVSGKRTEHFKERMASIAPQLIQALQTLGNTEYSIRLSEAIAPLALQQANGLGQTLEQVFKGTMLEPVLENLKKQ